MKKVLLTEAQVKLLTEEINKNDSIQKLIFSNPSEIKFEVSDEAPSGIPTSRALYRLTPVIDGKEIDGQFVNFLAEEVNLGGETFYQLHINVDYDIRRLGIAEKLYTAFLTQGYPVCSLLSNRTASFYSEQGQTVEDDSAIENLWNKLKQNSEFEVDDVSDANGNVIGLIAYKK